MTPCPTCGCEMSREAGPCFGAELLGALKECAERLQIHMKHTEDLIAHMRATRAIEDAEQAHAPTDHAQCSRRRFGSGCVPFKESAE